MFHGQNCILCLLRKNLFSFFIFHNFIKNYLNSNYFQAKQEQQQKKIENEFCQKSDQDLLQ